MWKKYASTFLLLLFWITASTQNGNALPDLTSHKTVAAKLKVLSHVCDSLSNIEEYEKEREVATYALTIVPQNDFYHLSAFNYYIGYSLLPSVNEKEAIHYMEQALFWGEKAKDATKIFDALESLSNLYNRNIGYETKRAETAKKLEHILDTTHSDRLKSHLYGALSSYYSVIGQREIQVLYQIKSLELALLILKKGTATVIDSSNAGVFYITIGESYIEMKQPEKAMQYLISSRPFLYSFQGGMSYYYRDIALVFTDMNQLKKAHLFADSLLQLVRKTNTQEIWENYYSLSVNFADHFIEQNNADSALPYLREILNTSRSKEISPILITTTNCIIGKALILKKDFAGALIYLKKAEPGGADIGSENYATLMINLAKCYAGLRDWENATRYYSIYAPLRDSIYFQSSKQSLANAEAQYQNREKQQQIELQDSQLIYSRKQKIWLIVALSLSALVTFLSVIIYRSKKRTADAMDEKNKHLTQLNNELEEANRTKATLFGIISHDLRSPISQVYYFLKLQQLDPDHLSDGQKTELTNKIQTATGSLLETMEDLLFWAKTQMNTFEPNMQVTELNPVLDQCLALLHLNIETKNIEVIQHIAENTIVLTDPYFLETIFRNLLQNAVKASPENGKVTIDQLSSAPDFIEISISNAGNSFKQEDYLDLLASKDDRASLSGLGLRLVDELAQKIKVRVRFQENGTADKTVTLITIPLA